MKVDELLPLLKVKAQLNEVEVKELEKTFFELLGLKVLERLGSEFSKEQKELFIDGLEIFQKEKTPESAVKVLQGAGLDANKANEYLQSAAKQALDKIIEVLGDRLSEEERDEILHFVQNDRKICQ